MAYCWRYHCGEQLPCNRRVQHKEAGTNKLSPHMTRNPVIEPGTHWCTWKASALTSVPTLHPSSPITVSNDKKCSGQSPGRGSQTSWLVSHVFALVIVVERPVAIGWPLLHLKPVYSYFIFVGSACVTTLPNP